MAPEKRFTASDTWLYSIIMVAQQWLTLFVGDRGSTVVVTSLGVEPAQLKRRRRSCSKSTRTTNGLDVADDWTSCHTGSANSKHAGKLKLLTQPDFEKQCLRSTTSRTGQAWKDTPSLTGVKGLGRLKGCSCKKGDFQQWSKQMEAFSV